MKSFFAVNVIFPVLIASGVLYTSSAEKSCLLCDQFLDQQAGTLKLSGAKHRRPTYQCYTCTNCSLTLDLHYVFENIESKCFSCSIEKLPYKIDDEHMYELGCDTESDCCGHSQGVTRKCCADLCNLPSQYDSLPTSFFVQCHQAFLIISSISVLIVFLILPVFIICIYLGQCEAIK